MAVDCNFMWLLACPPSNAMSLMLSTLFWHRCCRRDIDIGSLLPDIRMISRKS